MCSEQNIESMRHALGWLEFDPPNWFAAAQHLHEIAKSDDFDRITASFSRRVHDYTHLYEKGKSCDRALIFLSCVHCNGGRQELIETLRSFLPLPAHDVLIKKNAKLRADRTKLREQNEALMLQVAEMETASAKAREENQALKARLAAIP
jgi:hypothetical protein